MTQTYTGTQRVPQADVVDPVDLASSEDLRAFLEYVEKAIAEKMNRQSDAVKQLLLEGYGNIEVRLKVHRGKLVVADVSIGTTYKLTEER